MEELIRRIRENKYLTRNETDFIIKALEGATNGDMIKTMFPYIEIERIDEWRD